MYDIYEEVSDIYEELRKNYFFHPNESKSTDKPFQPIKWRIFTATNNSKFRIEIAKSVPYVDFLIMKTIQNFTLG